MKRTTILSAVMLSMVLPFAGCGQQPNRSSSRGSAARTYPESTQSPNERMGITDSGAPHPGAAGGR